MLIGSICAAIAICLLGGVLCFRYVRQTFDEVDHMLDQAIQGHFDFATIAGETRQGKLCHKVKRLIQKLQADAEESAVEKSNVQGIISDISHQMKTPLASICMYTSLLMEENLTPKETQEFLLRTKNSANRLQWMMDTLFKMSRLETGAIALSPEYFSLRHTLLTSSSAVQGGLSSKQMRIALHDFEDMELKHDPKWTAEAIGNVLENAIKYAPEKTSIDIAVQPLSLYVRIDITDHGEGIPSEEWNDVFKRFYRGKNVKGKEGAGLGLYLTSLILSKQGGYIMVNSDPGESCTFSVFLQNC